MTRGIGPGAVTYGLGLFTGQHPSGGPPLYRQALDLARAAEDAGFDTFWTSEHHGLEDGYLPSPLTLLAAVTARTSTIRLACGLATAPLYHPIRLAEEAAVVDQLSEGRLTLGLGLGYSRQEYQTFGVADSRRGARLRDLLLFLRTAWRGERFEDGYLIGRGDPGIVSATTRLLGETAAGADPESAPDIEQYLHAVGDVDEVAHRVIEALSPLRGWANVHVVIRALVPQAELRPQLKRVERLGDALLPLLRREP